MLCQTIDILFGLNVCTFLYRSLTSLGYYETYDGLLQSIRIAIPNYSKYLLSPLVSPHMYSKTCSAIVS